MPLKPRWPLAALVATLPAGPVAAQPVNCADLYNRMMALYQTAPGSPEYAQLFGAYGANCAGGQSAGPGPEAPDHGFGGSRGGSSGNLPLRGSPESTSPMQTRREIPGSHNPGTHK